MYAELNWSKRSVASAGNARRKLVLPASNVFGRLMTGTGQYVGENQAGNCDCLTEDGETGEASGFVRLSQA